MISRASALRYDFDSSVTTARTRSPGRQWRTNTTRPSSARATQPPPAAIGPASRSRRGKWVTCSRCLCLPHSSGPSSFRQLTSVPVRLQVGLCCRPCWLLQQWGSAVHCCRRTRTSNPHDWSRLGQRTPRRTATATQPSRTVSMSIALQPRHVSSAS